MRLLDTLLMAVSSLRRMKVRSLLTICGVMIGVGAMTAMISFGVGAQHSTIGRLKESGLFRTILVFPKGGKLEDAFREFTSHEEAGSTQKGDSARTGELAVPLDVVALEKIRELDRVELALPEVTFPARLSFDGKDMIVTARGLPLEVAQFGDAFKITEGKLFSSEDDRLLLLSPYLARRLGHEEDSSLVGKRVRLSFLQFSPKRFNPLSLLGGEMPFKEDIAQFVISGICDVAGFGQMLGNVVFIPMKQAEEIESLSFQDFEEVVWSLREGKRAYLSARVLVDGMASVEPVREKIDEMGFRTMTIFDELEELKKFFLIFNAILGAVGGISLFVGCLGIANTMLMSVLERRREIGVFKAVGARDSHVSGLFFFEAGLIGFVGGVLGLLLGYGVAQVVEAIMNYYMKKAGAPPEALSLFPWWLMAGGVVFAVVVSLVAGGYPARRAARIDPVRALRAE